jgi:cytochrome c oxidase cbb3-type subunit 3
MSSGVIISSVSAGGGRPVTPSPDVLTHQELSSNDISEGKRLYQWYNCNTCHANGGGNIGPALMDDQWIYGAEPKNIFATILEGRPNGMPSFRGKIPDAQVWQIVAYVRSLSGHVPSVVRSSRPDDMSAKAPENTMPKQPVNGQRAPNE